VRRFFAHLQITDAGPINVSRDLVNPAAEIEIRRAGAIVGIQWAFMRFPAHARPDIPRHRTPDGGSDGDRPR
jgi:hypothetical protein